MSESKTTKHQIKQGYKQTESGVIPEDWEIKPLYILAEKIMVGIASAATHAYRDKGIVLFRNQNIKSGYLDDSDILYITPEYEAGFKNKRLKSGDLLTARTGYPGTTCIVPPFYESAQSFTTLITRPDSKKVNSEFLCCYINSEHGQNFFEQNQIGGGQKNVNAGSLKLLPVPLPPTRDEQAAIAHALSDIDALIESLDRLLTKNRQIKQGAMQELLYPYINGQLKPGWKIETIDSMCIPGGLVRRPFGGALKKECFVTSGFKVYEQRNAIYRNVEIGKYFINSDKYQELKRFEVKGKDFIISCSGTIGRIYQIPEGSPHGVINQALLKLTIDSEKYSEDYFRHYFGWEDFQSKIIDNTQGGAMKNLVGMPIFKSTEIPLPQKLKNQAEIATILSDMDAEIDSIEAKLTKTRQIKQGMMHELLTGRIRLI
jgi:type I restriction enzyme, S subunit